MEIKRGQVYTPDKKGMLIQEVRDELSKLDNLLKKDGYVSEIIVDLKKVRDNLTSILKTLVDKRGIITPQETDSVLDSINLSQKTRLSADNKYKTMFNPATLLLVVLVGYGIYHIYKGKA